jgi:hypothetical protein
LFGHKVSVSVVIIREPTNHRSFHCTKEVKTTFWTIPENASWIVVLIGARRISETSQLIIEIFMPGSQKVRGGRISGAHTTENLVDV